MLTNCHRMFVALGISAPSVMEVKSSWIWYWSTDLKSLFSFVRRMGFVISFPKILVIPSAISSLTPIAARGETFYRSDSSWASLLFVISSSTVLSSVLTRSAAALDDAIRYLFLMCIVDLYSLSALRMLLASTFILLAESLYNCRLRTRSICVNSVFTSLYA